MFNKEYDLNIDSHKLDEIMSRDYKSSKNSIKEINKKALETPLESASKLWPKIKQKVLDKS